jgi:DNA polymerase III delta prime subunit
VPLLPLYGHVALRARLREAIARNSLPASLLFHGPRGTGKQQLALWVARVLLCENADRAPCGACQSCRLAVKLHHPDLHWYFPRPRLKGSDPDLADVRHDIAEGIEERLENGGLYEPPGGDEALYVATVRAIVQSAVMSPAMGRKKVFVIGDAERMVAQEGSDQAANAFLKLLEEPPADTTLILTSSEPGALLPTIRSRSVSVRVPALADADVRAFLADETVANRLDLSSEPATSELVRLAAGLRASLSRARPGNGNPSGSPSARRGAVPRPRHPDACRAEPGASGAEASTLTRSMPSSCCSTIALRPRRARGMTERRLAPRAPSTRSRTRRNRPTET